ncbi:hypothetical protein ES702_02583 [subsurface metagenome]
MRVILKKAFKSFWASRKTHAEIWELELYAWQKSIEAQGDEIIDIQPITNPYGMIRFWLIKIKQKADSK